MSVGKVSRAAPILMSTMLPDPGGVQVLPCDERMLAGVLTGDQLAVAGQGPGEPDRAVAAEGADLENASGADGRREQHQQLALRRRDGDLGQSGRLGCSTASRRARRRRRRDGRRCRRRRRSRSARSHAVSSGGASLATLTRSPFDRPLIRVVTGEVGRPDDLNLGGGVPRTRPAHQRPDRRLGAARSGRGRGGDRGGWRLSQRPAHGARGVGTPNTGRARDTRGRA